MPRFKDCAVAFDAGYMQTKSMGSRIDSYAHVWRVNVRRPPIALGNRTSVMTASFAADNPASRLVQTIGEWDGLEMVVSFETGFNKKEMYMTVCSKLETHWYFVPRNFATQCAHMVGKKCSTGMLTALLAQQQCESVNLFGGQNNSGHDYIVGRSHHGRSQKDHDINHEHTLYRRWNDFKVD